MGEGHFSSLAKIPFVIYLWKDLWPLIRYAPPLSLLPLHIHFVPIEGTFLNLADSYYVTCCGKRLWPLTNVMQLTRSLLHFAPMGKGHFSRFNQEPPYDISLEGWRTIIQVMPYQCPSLLCPHEIHFSKFSRDSSWNMLQERPVITY